MKLNRVFTQASYEQFGKCVTNFLRQNYFPCKIGEEPVEKLAQNEYWADLRV